MTSILCIIFFFSGIAALMFELLWFQLAGITFGNSIYASTVVLASFMGGLALGNGLTAIKGPKIKKPVRFYALIEIGIAVTGFLIVLLFPTLTGMLAPVYKSLSSDFVLINSLRMLISFFVLLIPTTAMGATLPLLVKALYRSDHNYGKILGALYGWNTLGAVFGVLICEFFLIEAFGILGCAAVASTFNLLAAILAIKLFKDESKAETEKLHYQTNQTTNTQPLRITLLLTASFLGGFILLALEVIWFRFILLFFHSTSINFAIMLSTVLLGISFGGLAGSYLFRKYPNAQKSISYLFLANSVFIILLYTNFGSIIEIFRSSLIMPQIVISSLFLMFPICFISGIIYTLMGKLIFLNLGEPTKSAGILTLTNTTGALIGSVAGGLIFLPMAGVEHSFFVLSIVCGLAALVTAYAQNWWQSPKVRTKLICGLVLCVAALLLFPFGMMKKRYLDLTLPSGIVSAEKRVAYREGLTETIQYLQRELLQRPVSHRLVTNSLSMSGTNLRSKRYMKFFVYLPLALNQQMEDALLICYGCGSTAKALTDTKSLKEIDFVDISKDVFELSRIVYPDPEQNPINDPRVRLHVEDGRFFLTATNKLYDLITAEPPPPKNTGIVNLYTQEYFELIYNRLKPGGITTYWLPVYQLEEKETKAILKAFSNAFPSCSLWTGAELDWMMVGIKEPLKIADEDEISSQWDTGGVKEELRALGFVEGGQLGSFFIADGDQIKEWAKEIQPLVDNYPKRLSSDLSQSSPLPTYYSFMAPEKCKERFVSSPHIKSIWPTSFIQNSQMYFPFRKTIDNLLAQRMPEIYDLHNCINHKSLASYHLWAYRSEQFSQDIISNAIKKGRFNGAIDNMDDVAILRHLAARAGAEKNYDAANNLLAIAAGKLNPMSQSNNFYYSYRAYLYYIQGETEKAKQVLIQYTNLAPELKEQRDQYAGKVWHYLSSLNLRPNHSIQ